MYSSQKQFKHFLCICRKKKSANQIFLLFRPLDDSGDDDNDKDDNGDDNKFDEVNEKDAHLSLQHVLLLEIRFCICRHPGKRQDFGQHRG